MQRTQQRILSLLIALLAIFGWLAAPFSQVFATESTSTFYAKLLTNDKTKAVKAAGESVGLDADENYMDRVWQFTYNATDHSYIIGNKATNTVLTAGINQVALSKKTSAPNQKWVLSVKADNTFTFTPLSNATKALTLNAGNLALGTAATGLHIIGLSSYDLQSVKAVTITTAEVNPTTSTTPSTKPQTISTISTSTATTDTPAANSKTQATQSSAESNKSATTSTQPNQTASKTTKTEKASQQQTTPKTTANTSTSATTTKTDTPVNSQASTDKTETSQAKKATQQNFLVKYQVHIQKVGWQAKKSDGATAGTTGKSLRIEALKISLGDTGYTGGVKYRSYVQNTGWQSWVSNGALSGTSGKSLRVEALQIKLTGDIASQYDVYYRAHVQNIGWMGWAKNGASAGTNSLKYRIEALQIKLVKKGESAPGSTANAFKKGPTLSKRQKVINIAKSQIGYHEGGNNYTKYGVWYGKLYGSKYGFSNAPWCAMFVSWCGNQAGLSNKIYYYHAYCPSGVSWYQNKGRWRWKSSYTPKSGDIIYYDWNGDRVVEHVGLVESCKNGKVTTIEGNYSDQVKRRTISSKSSYIFGYASPNY